MEKKSSKVIKKIQKEKKNSEDLIQVIVTDNYVEMIQIERILIKSGYKWSHLSKGVAFLKHRFNDIQLLSHDGICIMINEKDKVLTWSYWGVSRRTLEKSEGVNIIKGSTFILSSKK